MSAGTWNILADQGSTFGRVLKLYTSAGTLMNLTGYTAKMQVRESVDSSTVVLELSTGNGRIALGGAAGTVTLTVAASDMNFQGRYVYDLEITSGAGTVTREVMGMMLVRPEVTK